MVSIRHTSPSSGAPLPLSDWDADHDVPIATQDEAIAGLADNVLMTPERVGQAIAVVGREEVEAMLIEGTNVTITPSGTGAARTLTISASGGGGGGSVAWADITGKPSTFAPSAHSHVIGDVTGLQTALDGKANLASPQFVGAPSAPTPATGTNSTQLATTAFVQAALTALIGTSPGVLDTLGELADALGDDPNFAGTVTTALAGKQPLDATLTALAGLAGGANQLAYFTGTDVLAQTTLTAFGRTVMGLADYASLRTGLNVADGATANATDAQLRDRSTHTGAQAISTVTGLQAALDGKVASNPTGITGADAITNIVSLTQAEYDAIPTKNATTFYVVTA